MPAEHQRPDGLYRGYYCLTCGAPGLNMVGSGHGPGLCQPNPELVRQLRELNKPEANRVAKYDYGGGCPCGLFAECVPSCQNYEPKTLDINKQPSLGDQLKDILEELEAAKIKSLEEKANADREKIRKRRLEVYNFLNDFYGYVVKSIMQGRVPLKKVKDYDMQQWIRNARDGKAEHQDIWNEQQKRLSLNKLAYVIEEAHDGMGMESWINLSVAPRIGTYRSSEKIGEKT